MISQILSRQINEMYCHSRRKNGTKIYKVWEGALEARLLDFSQLSIDAAIAARDLQEGYSVDFHSAYANESGDNIGVVQLIADSEDDRRGPRLIPRLPSLVG